MKVPTIKYQLSDKTIKLIEQKTKCSINELSTLPTDEIAKIMQKRGVVKKPNKIKLWFADKYKQLGEKLGLLKKEYNFYTHVD